MHWVLYGVRIFDYRRAHEEIERYLEESGWHGRTCAPANHAVFTSQEHQR